MTLLKILLLTLAIFSLLNIVINLVQIGMVLRNKGKVSVTGWYFTVFSIMLAASTATLIVIW